MTIREFETIEEAESRRAELCAALAIAQRSFNAAPPDNREELWKILKEAKRARNDNELAFNRVLRRLRGIKGWGLRTS